MKKLLILAAAISLAACEKEAEQQGYECTACTYTVTNTHSNIDGSGLYIKNTDSGTYSESDEPSCILSKEEYESKVRQELQDRVDYSNALNPHFDVDLITWEVVEWNEVHTFTLSCE